MTSVIRRLGVVVAIAFLGFAPRTSTQMGVAASSPPPTFGVPVVSGVQGYGFEQDVRLDTKGTVYTSSPDSLSSTTSFLWRSFDRGQTFKLVPAATQPNGKLLSCPGGGDTELATDSANNLYSLLKNGCWSDSQAEFYLTCQDVQCSFMRQEESGRRGEHRHTAGKRNLYSV